PVTASHLRLFFGAGHYALKVDNDGLTRRRGGRGELHGDWSFIRHASLRGLRASARGFFTGSACRRTSPSRRLAPPEPPPGPSPERLRLKSSSAISRKRNAGAGCGGALACSQNIAFAPLARQAAGMPLSPADHHTHSAEHRVQERDPRRCPRS